MAIALGASPGASAAPAAQSVQRGFVTAKTVRYFVVKRGAVTCAFAQVDGPPRR